MWKYGIILIMLYIFDELDTMAEDFPDNVMPLLSRERLLKVQKLRMPQGKKASAVVYLLLRTALLECYGINEAVEFDYVGKGKPVLRDHPQIHFNLSHTKNAVACAVSDVPVGVDIQNIAPVSDRVAKRVLTEQEYNEFKESAKPDEYFCEKWTIKESYLKLSGQGIDTDMRTISADSVSEKEIHRGNDYICCVCGPKLMIKHKQIGTWRDEFDKLN